MSSRFRFWVSRIASWLLGATAFMTPLIGWALKVDPTNNTNDMPPPLLWLVEKIHAWGWLLLIGLGITTGLMKLLAHAAGELWARRGVEALLDELQKRGFNNANGDPLHHHRVTLFKYKPWTLWMTPRRARFWPWGKGRWPWSGWLTPVMRSGHASQKVTATFLVPDDADSAEGVAGQAWATGIIVYCEGLPRVTRNSSLDRLDRYCRRSFTPPEMVEARLKSDKPLPQSLCGVPINGKHGRPWGVLVLDSRRPDGIKSREEIDDILRVVQTLLAKLVVVI